MKRWVLFILIGVVVFSLVALAGYAWLAAPQAGNFSPLDEAQDVPVHSPIRVGFSQPMQQASVESRLHIDPPRDGEFAWDGNTLTFTPNKPWPGNTLVQVQLDSGGRAESGLGLPVWRDHQWSFNTAQALLAYLWPSDGPSDLFMLDPLSGEIRRLSEGADILDYSISQDGLFIYYSAGNPQAGADLYRLDLLEATSSGDSFVQPELLLACQINACRSPKVSPDGKLLAYERVIPGGGSSSQIWLLDLTTLEAQSLGDEGHLTDNPSWSSEGLLAYYDHQQSAYVIYDPITNARFLAINTTGEPGVWAPDGSSFVAPEIVYVTAADGETTLGSSHLIRYTPFGPSFDLTEATIREDTAPAFSPDGRMIAFARKYLEGPEWGFGRQLWIMNADGTQSRQVTDQGVYNHFDFAFSWDGRWLAYVRFENESYSELVELWLSEADGSNPIQLNFGGYSPQWIP
jgi:Tol biopolymer transport system component